MAGVPRASPASRGQSPAGPALHLRRWPAVPLARLALDRCSNEAPFAPVSEDSECGGEADCTPFADDAADCTLFPVRVRAVSLPASTPPPTTATRETQSAAAAIS